ncbi:MAG: ABC transporter permease [Phycisphaerae bacterium]|nr:ABC transporter permease [Phycisphaerae bacterium]
MLLGVIVKVGVRSLWANRMRSFLAMLGIIIGVGAVISMLAMGTGAKRSILAQIQAMGTNLLSVRPGLSGARGVTTGTRVNLTLEDAQAIAAGGTGVRRLSPVVSGNVQAKYMNHNNRVTVNGAAMTFLPIRDFTIEKGRSFTEIEAEQSARVAILGPEVATDLFGANDPIGEAVKLKGINFTVIGVTKAKGGQGFSNPDDEICIPYTTAMKQVFGVDHLREILVQADEGADLAKVEQSLRTVLRQRHKLAADANDDFDIRNQADLIERVSQSTQTFTILLGGIASISLLVGGIGIMNIMLVSVTERTREIGIRKAIGAKERTILLQFLLEAMITTGLGGLIGVAAGMGGAGIIGKASQFTTVVEPFSVILALSFSAFIGVFFGFYPAWRAARLDPVDALRYE